MKYKSVIICLVILLCAALFIPQPAKSQVTVGADSGKGEKIESVEDLLGVLYCISGGNLHGSISVNGNETLSYEESKEVIASLIAFSTSSESVENSAAAPEQLASERKSKDDDKEITEYDFDSFTVHEYAHMSSGYGGMDTSSVLNRELSIYVCDEITYYRSVGRATAHSQRKDADGDYETMQSFADFDMEFYMDEDEDEVYMKVNSFYMSAEESVCFSNEIIGKWILVDSAEFMSTMFSINSQNLVALSELSSAISTAYFDGEIRNKTKTKTLNKNDLGDMYDDNFEKFDVKIDITNAETPKIGLLMIQENSASGKNYRASLEALYTFENIDNTKVSMGKNVDIFEIDEDDIEDYIWVED